MEGWGTFCERLVLDLGFSNSGPASLTSRKRNKGTSPGLLSTYASTKGMTEAQVKEFVTKDAFQGEQLARNMWMRTLTTAPRSPATSWADRVKSPLRRRAPRPRSAFVLRQFMDGMMDLGGAGGGIGDGCYRPPK